MSETIIQLILKYYAFFWILNVAAYATVSYGLYRWWRFLKGASAESIIKTSLRITTGFALARLTVGLIGVTLYELDQIPALLTILLLGMTSLPLNTSFIMLEGWAVNKEAKVLWSLPEADREEVKELWEAADRLKRVTGNA